MCRVVPQEGGKEGRTEGGNGEGGKEGTGDSQLRNPTEARWLTTR